MELNARGKGWERLGQEEDGDGGMSAAVEAVLVAALAAS